MYLTDRFSQLLRCEVAFTWDVNDLTFICSWKQLQLPVWRYVCVTDVFVREALYLSVTHSTCSTSCPYNRNPMSSFSGTGRFTNSIAWKRWNKWLLLLSKKKNLNEHNFDGEVNWSGVVNFHCMQMSLVMSIRFIFGDDWNITCH